MPAVRAAPWATPIGTDNTVPSTRIADARITYSGTGSFADASQPGWFDLSDTSLEHAYSHASALVFPSYVEGFGLPLVEAMQRGLQAMGSDIPVFREIGGEFMAYFDLEE